MSPQSDMDSGSGELEACQVRNQMHFTELKDQFKNSAAFLGIAIQGTMITVIELVIGRFW